MPVVMTARKSPTSASCSMYTHACMQFSGQLTAQVFPHKSLMPGEVAFGFKVQRSTLENYTKAKHVVDVGKLTVSKYVVESINNYLQDISTMKAFISCIQNSFVRS